MKMKRLLILLIASVALFSCKKNDSSNNTTTLKDYYIKCLVDGKEKVITDDTSLSFIYHGSTEGSVGLIGINGSLSFYPSDSINDFTAESQFLDLLNEKLEVNTTTNNTPRASADLYMAIDGTVYTTFMNEANNSYPANYFMITNITYVYSESSGFSTYKYYNVSGEFVCNAKSSSGALKTLNNGTFRVKVGIEVL